MPLEIITFLLHSDLGSHDLQHLARDGIQFLRRLKYICERQLRIFSHVSLSSLHQPRFQHPFSINIYSTGALGPKSKSSHS
jgi:hypothetical protein